MKLTKQIEALASIRIKYLSTEYLMLPAIVQKFAEAHILYNGWYSFTWHGTNERVLITR